MECPLQHPLDTIRPRAATYDQAAENRKETVGGGKGRGRRQDHPLLGDESRNRLEPPALQGQGRSGDMLKGLGVPYAIIRPTPVFGDVDLLLNKMAWELRRLPVFPVHESDNYLVRPVYVEDLAAQSVQAGSQSENSIAGTAGPDTFSFEELLRLLGFKMGIPAWLVHTAPLGLALTQMVGLLKRDMALTRDGVVGLMAGLLTSDKARTGRTRLG